MPIAAEPSIMKSHSQLGRPPVPSRPLWTPYEIKPEKTPEIVVAEYKNAIVVR